MHTQLPWPFLPYLVLQVQQELAAVLWCCSTLQQHVQNGHRWSNVCTVTSHFVTDRGSALLCRTAQSWRGLCCQHRNLHFASFCWCYVNYYYSWTSGRLPTGFFWAGILFVCRTLLQRVQSLSTIDSYCPKPLQNRFTYGPFYNSAPWGTFLEVHSENPDYVCTVCLSLWYLNGSLFLQVPFQSLKLA